MVFRMGLFLMAILPLFSRVEGVGVLEEFLFRKNPTNPPPMIRTLIVSDRPGVVIEVKGKYHLYDPKTDQRVDTRFEGKRNYIQALRGGLRWGEEFPGLYQVKIVPDDQTITTVVDGIEYRGSVYVYDVEGKIAVVNEVFIEDYLASLLTPQITVPLAKEVLAAIAIAARTNAFYQASNPPSPFWDVDGRKVGYHGYAVTDERSPIERAIHLTKHLILSRGNGGNNGNETVAPFLLQWGPVRAGKEPFDESSISIEEAQEIALKGGDASKILKKAYPGTSIILTHYTRGK